MRRFLRNSIITGLFICLSSVLMNAQHIATEKRISIHLQNASFPEFIMKLTEASGTGFSYNPDKIDLQKKINIHATELNMHEILQLVLPEMELEYLLIEEKIVIRKMKDKPAGSIVLPEKKMIILSGFIRDAASGEALIGASVSVPGTSTGTICNEYGFYSLRLEEGQYEIACSFIGYHKKIKSLTLFSNSRISVELNRQPTVIEEVKINAYEQSKLIIRNQTSEDVIRSESISDMPDFMGEPDVIKSLQTLPGIKFYGDGSTLFYVRGGNRDQNLILIDEAVLYNPSHLLGIFSSLSPGAINSMKIFKGDIPAEYGGRLSSLIDIKTKEGNNKELKFSGNTGFFATSINLEGPFKKNRSSYFVSARRSQLKWIFRKAAPNLEDLYFSDVNIKLNFRLNDYNRIFFTTYAGKDKFINGGNSSSSGIQWENAATTMRWNHIFNERFFLNTSLTGSRFDYDFITALQQGEMWNSYISNLALKSDFAWYRSPGNTVKFGILLGRHYFNPGNFESSVNPNTGVPKVPSRNTRERAIYFSNENEFSEALSIRYGLRLSGWSNVGEAYEVVYNDERIPVDTSFYPEGTRYNRYIAGEPRVSLRLILSPRSSIKAAYSRTSQFVNLLSNSISPFTSMEVWLPASLNIKPQIANQLVGGYHHLFDQEIFSFSAEVFYKKMKNQIGYSEHAQMLFNPFIESELRFGESISYGLELMVSKSKGNLTGWLAYTLSKTSMQFEEINKGKSFPASYDRPHDLSIVGQFRARPRWNLSASWIIMSGGAYTSPTGFYVYNNYQVPVYDQKNNSRLPVYHRLDLATELQLNKAGARSEHNLKFSLYNAYGRKNPIAINFNKISDENETILVPANHANLPELVNSMTYLFTIVPSLSYNFSF
jgi:hypothetical protein